METKCLKRAVKREAGYPLGSLAPMYLDCECGQKVTLPVIAGLPMTYVCGVCGIEYDSRGNTLNR